jgi:hypothetical protein
MMKISLQFDGYDEFTKYMGRFAEITHLLKGETGKATIQVQMPAEVSTTPQQTVTPVQQAVTPVQQAVVQTPQEVPFAPVQQATQSVTPVQTEVHNYTLDELSKAAVQLMDAGKQAELVSLINTFGVMSMPELPKERYGEFAVALRELGAQL